MPEVFPLGVTLTEQLTIVEHLGGPPARGRFVARSPSGAEALVATTVRVQKAHAEVSAALAWVSPRVAKRSDLGSGGAEALLPQG
jgi:hypothetical protein